MSAIAAGVRLCFAVVAWWSRRSGRSVFEESVVKRRVPGVQKKSEDGTLHLASLEGRFAETYPAIAKHCAVKQYDDGTPRQTGWITVKTVGSAWVIQVKDPDSCLSFACHEQSLDNALLLVDMLLASDEAPWEQDTYLKQQQKKLNK